MLEQLRSSGHANAPITDTAGEVEAFAEADLKRARRTDEGGRIVTLIKGWYSACDNARGFEKRQWLKDLDMVHGRQFTEWNPGTARMEEIPKLEHEPRIVINIVEPTVRTEMAKTGSTHPTATVSPASNDLRDIMASIAGERAWDWFYRTSKFHVETFTPANWWRTTTGNGFIKTYFDANEIDDAATEAAEREWETQRRQWKEQQAQAHSVFQLPFMEPKPQPVRGKITTTYVTPFHLLVPDLAELNLQRQRYVLHTYTIPLEQAKLRYRHLVGEDWNPSPIAADTILNTAHLGIKSGDQSNPDSVQVIEAYVKPGVTALLPDGGFAVIVADQLVELRRDGLPYQHRQFPFAHLQGIETGRFYRKSVVESITPLQNELNRTYAQIIKAKNLAIKPMFFYDEGSVDPRRIRAKAGTYIPIRLGMRYPQPVPIQELPSFVTQLIERIKQHQDDISGQHQVSRAISPGADTAASALALLQETDDNFLSTTFDSIESAVETIARQTLSLMVQFWETPRLVKVTGQSSGFDALMLAGSDLAGGTDIYIDEGSGLPKSKTARTAIITEWIDKGIIPPEVGLEAMEAGTLGKVYERLKLDRDHARRENVRFSRLTAEDIQAHQAQFEQAVQQGMADLEAEVGEAAQLAEPPAPTPVIPVNWYDNHMVHYEEHAAYAKSQEYESLPPEVQEQLRMHAEAHLQEALAMQQPAPGADAPDAPAGPGQPDDYADTDPAATAA